MSPLHCDTVCELVLVHHRRLAYTPYSDMTLFKLGLRLPHSLAATSASEPVEDFVHIENSNPDAVEALNESVVSIADEVRDNNGAVSEENRKMLPEELSRSVVLLMCHSFAKGGICDFYLIGTAHVSQESCREVEAIIDYLKPQIVFLELCLSRVAVLTPQNLKVPTVGEMVEMWKKKHNMFGIL